MNEHISTYCIARFSVGSLPKPELDQIARHLGTCAMCDDNVAEELRRQRGSAPLSFNLAPEIWIRHEHLDYEQLVNIAEDRLDDTDREIINIHLDLCSTCREDLHSFLAFLEQERGYEEAEVNSLLVRGIEGSKDLFKSIWHGLLRSPAYAISVIVLLGVALTVSTVLMTKRTRGLQAQGNETTQITDASPVRTPTKQSTAASDTRSPLPNDDSELPHPKISHRSQKSVAGVIAILNDEHGTVAIDRGGRVTGLNGVSVIAQREIEEVLRAEKLERPEILQDLASYSTPVRGSNSDRTFKLLSPVGVVTSADRPTLKWEGTPNASSYRVIIGDSYGKQAAKSEVLPSDKTEWTTNAPLQRGEIYSWVVVAVVDRKEVVAPGPTSPEVKFQVLPTNQWQELHRLRKTSSHIALGVFYSRVGMLDEAEREFEELVQLNRNSKLASNLLRSIRSMRIKQ